MSSVQVSRKFDRKVHEDLPTPFCEINHISYAVPRRQACAGSHNLARSASRSRGSVGYLRKCGGFLRAG